MFIILFPYTIDQMSYLSIITKKKNTYNLSFPKSSGVIEAVMITINAGTPTSKKYQELN